MQESDIVQNTDWIAAHLLPYGSGVLSGGLSLYSTLGRRFTFFVLIVTCAVSFGGGQSSV